MDENQLAKMFKALSNPNRLRLFQEIRKAQRTSFEHRCSLSSVVAALSVGAPTVSHHLKELVNAGLIETEREGRFVHCSIVPEGVKALQPFLGTGTAPFFGTIVR